MRIREIVLASMLGFTFGCPGDDGETETGSMTSGMMTTTTTNASSGGGNESTSTGGGGGSTSTGGAEESTTGGGGNTSTGGAEESSSGGNAACDMFCADFAATCGGGQYDDYGGNCVQLCDQFEDTALACRIEHVGYAADEGSADSVHCDHASRSGGGVC